MPSTTDGVRSRSSARRRVVVAAPVVTVAFVSGLIGAVIPWRTSLFGVGGAELLTLVELIIAAALALAARKAPAGSLMRVACLALAAGIAVSALVLCLLWFSVPIGGG